ncbi:DUF2332 domain-containing protein [Nonomuraea sp. NPDC049649]|uniref:DUF2332 domain-containing protein n=1 Tax=Nonomuraea sp. NPDC049649 TaxID=3155776 RepID=UPI003425DA8D
MDTAERYRRFSLAEARGHSPIYDMLASRIARDTTLLTLIDRLPVEKRQPNLLFAAVRFLGGPVHDYEAFQSWTMAEWDRIQRTMRERRTQTNEPNRCAALLPALASLPGPLALIEVGASAGLCLYPDRYRYSYDDRPLLGPTESAVLLKCRTQGPVPLPASLPDIAWRTGIDLNPLDVRDPDDTRWLESLIWPEQRERLRRLRAAVNIARAEPANITPGDLNQSITDTLDQVPKGTTPVVFHSAVMAYLPHEARDSFASTMRSLSCRWISNEAPGVLPAVDHRLPRPVPGTSQVFVLSLDGRPLAFTGPHGQHLDWFSSSQEAHELT